MAGIPPIVEDLIRQLDETHSDTTAYTLEQILSVVTGALHRFDKAKLTKQARKSRASVS